MIEQEKDQDLLIKKAVQDFYNDVDIPDASSSWRKVHDQLQKRRKKQARFTRMKIIAGIVAVSFLINIGLNIDVSVTYANVISLFREVEQHVVRVFFQYPNEDQDRSSAKTRPPSVESTAEPSVPENATLEEATAKLAFPILNPTYIPKGFHLDVVRIFRDASGQYNNVYLEYLSETKSIFKVSQRLVEPQSASIKSDISKDAGTIKEAVVQGYQAILVVIPEGFTVLEWLTKDNVKVSISGKLTENEILRFAESLH
ncbi:DUF4367 domain-containing protein [Paenibacillus periandrae]|uniref:DUF4367 domain-containing protein n=1 Tax=Paenibacillus periandrae TaxID=1761741 RepID=UPI001F09EB43|nr:DUF4367 domain-containing protein [Paenibacillus periandrae]